MASVSEAPRRTSRSTYKRKGRSRLGQYAGAFWIHTVAGPAVHALERFGLAERVIGRFAQMQERNAGKSSPFRKYTPGPQDVFVATYAKSGTNWMMQIAHQLIWHGRGEFDHLHDVVPWPDMEIVPPMKWYAIPLQQADHWKDSPEQKRVIKSHYDWKLLPYSPEARYIMVIRDPKDVFVSNYFFLGQSIGKAMPAVDTWYKLFLSGKFPLGASWAANAAGYWNERHRPNVLVCSFKSMKRDLEGTVRKVANFLDIRATDELIQEVCRQSTFDYMKQIDHKFRVGKMIAGGSEGTMMRKGKQGDSSELLSPERQREIDAHFIAELKRLGSDLPYEEFADIAR